MNVNVMPSPPQSPKADRNRTIDTTTQTSKTSNPQAMSENDSTTRGSTTGATVAPSGIVERDPTAAAVTELLATMQNTLRALGNTFDVVGEQTIRVASLGPAVDTIYQV